ncbi:hypothetical protein SKAU_G00037640 [Synaphobranchus kaupii]|uniref:Uncharacterized protein n=1 Tax=Synaphobranchus kaupii TaxID=118154 RepID=A0A9Q1GGK4_SYNKA|nr:hypothetical protein SKAU_G00037640 [Synaphobranchus kaupii]
MGRTAVGPSDFANRFATGIRAHNGSLLGIAENPADPTDASSLLPARFWVRQGHRPAWTVLLRYCGVKHVTSAVVELVPWKENVETGEIFEGCPLRLWRSN